MIGPGEIFGELALIMEGSHCCMAHALQDSTMYIVPKKGLLNFLQTQTALLLKLTKIIGLRRQQIESRFSDLVFQTVPCRLARVLAELLRQYPESAPQGKQIKLRLTHKDLAHLAGTSRETVSVWFSRWKKQGILNTQHGHILIYDPFALEVLTKKDRPS
jgi:CRP/FNR family transcriptional regulator, cyclic AMP receptor protein